MKIKKLLWFLPLILGAVPFGWALIGGLYTAVTGFGGLLVSGSRYYGFPAFRDWVILYSYLAWPFYLAGAALIGVSLFMLLRKPKI
jgi:hypothetical protein